LRQKESAREAQVKNLQHWIRNRSDKSAENSGPIVDEEQAYLDTGADLICLGHADDAPVVRFLKQFYLIRRLLRKSPKRGQEVDSQTFYYSAKKIRWLSIVFTVSLGLVMLYGPMWWLNFRDG
jgi:hypothetical protein